MNFLDEDQQIVRSQVRLESCHQVQKIGAVETECRLYRLGLEAGYQKATKQNSRFKPMSLGNTQLTVELPVAG